jgi:hypothetical protein
MTQKRHLQIEAKGRGFATVDMGSDNRPCVHDAQTTQGNRIDQFTTSTDLPQKRELIP